MAHKISAINPNFSYEINKEPEYKSKESEQGVYEKSQYEKYSEIDHLIDELIDIGSECSDIGWDSFNAKPIRKDTISETINFLNLLFSLDDIKIKIPEISPAPNGSIVFEWRIKDHTIFTISLTENKKSIYAFVSSKKQESGEENFLDYIPNKILYFLKEYFQD
ncbi:MAG: hypothetical protein ACOC7U_01380 [Spirochaetota bacterium]